MPRPKRKRTNNDSKDSGERNSKRQRTKLDDLTFKLTFLDLPTDTKRVIMEYLTELDLYRLLVTSKDCASVAKLTLPRVHEEKRRIRFACQPEGMADFWNLFERKYGCYEETDKIDFWWVLDMMCDMFKVELHIDNRECKGNKRNVDIFLQYIEQIMVQNFGGAYYLMN